MPKIEEKQKTVAALEEKFRNATLIVFTDYRGTSVEEITTLRNRLRVPGVEYRVVKNTMAEFALKNLGLNQIIEHTSGPNAVLFSKEDPVGPVKTLFEFIKQYKKLGIKAGLLNGQVLSPDQVKNLAELPSREVLVSQVLGTLQAPITSFVYVLNANISGLARVLNQIKEKQEAV
ncbi:MAG: 50S ribosomal protein L10 [Syntrophomonadaceae bacterium]|nr:50S ribosomal protein L10 [Syntrophomonadaceae bacterium]